MTEDEAFGERPWLEAGDLNKDGNNVTIISVEKRVSRKTGDPVLDVGFKELSKTLTLFGRWGFRKINEILGKNNSDYWPNCRVKLVPVTVTINDGEPRESISIEPADPLEKPKPTLKRQTRNSKPATVGRQVDDDGEKIPF
jgi:hypothetical protein